MPTLLTEPNSKTEMEISKRMLDTRPDRELAKYLCDYCEDVAEYSNGDIQVCANCLPAAEYDLN